MMMSSSLPCQIVQIVHSYYEFIRKSRRRRCWKTSKPSDPYGNKQEPIQRPFCTMNLQNYHQHFFMFMLLSSIVVLIFIHGHCCQLVSAKNHEITENQAQDPSSIHNNKQNLVGEWSPWSPWSSCSRICDGGISTSVRRCISRTGCIGPHKRNKLCNMQPCILKTNFRQTQCSAFNNKPYRDRYYEWLAYIDPTDPCSLTCKAKGLNFVAKLAPHITDGTRCMQDSLDVCVAGKCLSVGCDLQLGSLKKIDDCGICGGDGSSCKNRSYAWSHRFLTNCSRPCAGGEQTSMVVCFDESTDTVVDDIFCAMKNKPEPLTNRCNEFDCKPKWETEDWTPCSKLCGTGFQTRKVYCMLERKNQIKTKVNDNQCQMKKPDTERKCNVEECAQWMEGPWSECSETCGNGIQKRLVVCKNNRGFPSNECDISLKPNDWRNCSDISNCLYGKMESQEDEPQIDPFPKMFNEPSYDIGPWSKCNVTCGKGYKKRSVKCIIYLEFSKTFATIPMNQCSGNRPSNLEVCYSYDCQLDDKNAQTTEQDNLIEVIDENDSYQWVVTGFTKCSERCLAGIQESIIECVRNSDGKRMSPEFCDLNSKPETYTKICNDHPCIPRWNTSQFGECSKKCGEGGSQTRIVQCIHEVTRGPNNFVLVPDYQCPLPKPSTEQKCNQIDCPAKWVVEPWQKCSRDCGGGLKKREIYCVKDFVFGGLQNVSNLECSIKKPKMTKQCNLKPCRSLSSIHSIHELVRKSKRNHFSGPFYNKFNSKNAFKVQGKISVVEGSRIKLSCPNWDREYSSSIIWLKGHDQIINNKRFALAEDILKIRNLKLSDTGVYKCIYNNNETMHSMFLHVLPKKSNDDKATTDDPSTTTEPSTTTVQYYKNEADEIEKYASKSKTIIGKINLREERKDFDGHFSNRRKTGGIHELIANFKKPLNNKLLPSPSSMEDNISGEIRFYEKIPSKEKKSNNKLNAQFNWITTDWSNCTIPCGGFGFKIRFSQCYAKMGNVTRIVEDSFCYDEGLQKPSTYEACGLESCFRWNIQPWSECQNCVDVNKAIQIRQVTCELLNGTILDDSFCFQNIDKPIVKQECYHSGCLPIWHTGEWKKCSQDDDCNENGSRLRPVRCVWQTSIEQPIDDSYCDEETKPNHIENNVQIESNIQSIE